MKILIEISNRHVHLSKKDYDKLFNEPMRKIKELSQKGEYASDKFVDLKGIGKIRVLGPLRKISQMEISETEAKKIKKQIPLRLSGNLKDAELIEINTEKGKIKIPTIIAKRHLHCSLKDAKKNRLKNGDIISVKVDGERGIIFNEVIVRVDSNFTTALHLDTDEGNAAGINKTSEGTIIRKK